MFLWDGGAHPFNPTPLEAEAGKPGLQSSGDSQGFVGKPCLKTKQKEQTLEIQTHSEFIAFLNILGGKG